MDGASVLKEPIINLMVIWALCVYGIYLAEHSALLPRPKFFVQGLAVAVGLVGLYIIMRRIH